MALPSRMDVPLILLAAGRSTRFGALKQVAPVGPGGASILVYSVVDAFLAGFSRVVLVVRLEIEDAIRDHLEQHLGTGLPIRLVHQTEPLGTAHAAMLALNDGPAAIANGIANGDDAYGREAFVQLRRSADRMRADGPVQVALVAYPIAGTLSEHGGVSRGWVQTDEEVVTSVEEIYEVREGAGRLTGRACEGTVTMPRDALGSMNLWMLGPGLRPLLEREFARHQREATGEEFALSTVLDRLAEAGGLGIRLGGVASGWFGLTFADDLPSAKRRMAEAHEAGHYTEPLSEMVDAFRRHTGSGATREAPDVSS